MILERQVMNSYNPDENQGALERLGIPVQTTPPEQVLIAGKAKSIRFRVSRPHGYSYGDVESYQFDYVIPTLEWYADTLHQRDLAVHKLGELVDKLEVDLLNAKAQLDNKDYNEAIGLAVETSEQDEEMEALLATVESLKAQLNEANQALLHAQNSPISSPDGEETYTREEVENFLTAAVEDASKQKDAEYAQLLVQKDEEFANHLEHIKEQARQEALQSAPVGYTDEEVQRTVEEAVQSAVEQAVEQAVAQAEAAKDEHYGLLLETQNASLADAIARATAAENAAPTGYSQEEVEQAVANAVASAVAAKEAEILSRIPEAKSIDQIAELTNEGDLKLRAENKTLKKSVDDLNRYSQELEEYIATIEGKAAKNPAPAAGNLGNGRALPKLRPEDL
jgi:hypothetical protein